jgi:hypothetical protein
MLRYALILLLAVKVLSADAQYEQHRWYFGLEAGLDFRYDPPKALSDGKTSAQEGTSTRCDSLGNLLFYTDGISVWDKNHEVMSNGTGLLGNTSSAQSAVIVKKPGSSSVYYIFTTWYTIHYSVVDMALNDGRGAVTTKNVKISNGPREFVHIIKEDNSDNFWIVYSVAASKNVYSHKFDENGFNVVPVRSSLVDNQNYGLEFLGAGDMAIMKGQDYKESFVQFYSFDKNTGKLKWLKKSLNIDYLIHQCASPDGKYLYVRGIHASQPGTFSVYNLKQIDLDSLFLDVYSYIILDSFYKGSSIKKGPDGHIYISNVSKSESLSWIRYPNKKGKACLFEKEYISLGSGRAIRGLPFDYYFNSPRISELQDAKTCTQDSTILGIEVFVPFDSVEWDFGDGTTLVSRSNQVKHRYAEPGTYCVKANVKLSTGNIRTEDSVTIYKSPNLYIGSDTLLCTRENSLKLNIPSYDSMLWSTGSLDSFIEITNSGSYSVTVIENECSSTDSINVYMIDCEVSYAGLCRGDTTFCQYNIEVDSALHRYERGSVESNKNFYAYTLEGTFYPQCTVFKNGLSKVVSDTLTIYNRPKAYLGQDTVVCNPIYLKNLVRSTDVVQTTWNHSFIGDSLKVLESGLFTVSVSHHGCVAEDTIFVSLEHCTCTLFIPNAFTPNGNYLNEVFKPISDCDIEYSMEIYNRWGEKIFQTEASEAWNTNGFQDGIYLWQMKVKFENNTIERRYGTVRVLR